MAAEFSLEEALGQGTGQPVEFSLEEALGKAPAVPEKDRESTFGSELVRGGKQLASSFRTGIGALVGSPEEAARAGLQRSEAIAKEAGEGASLEAVKRAYQEKGLLSAAGEVASQTPRALASQAAQLALMAGGAKAGALAGTAVAPGIGTVIGGALGAGATLLPQLFGSNVERQASEQMAGKEEVDINRLAAGAGAVGQTALETAGPALILGKRLVKGLLGITDDAALVTAKAQQKTIDAANRSLLSASGRGAVRGAAVEIPVEVASSIIERAQAGLDVTSPDAFTEYGEVIYQSALIGGPLGAASGAADTSLARQTVKTQPSGALQQVQDERDAFAKEFGEGTPVDTANLAPEPAPVAAVDLPGGFTVTQRELSREEVPESFGIFAEGSDKPLTTVATQADIDAKIASLTEIRAEEQLRLLEEGDKITKTIQAEGRKLDVMEATGKADTDEYVQAKALFSQKQQAAEVRLAEIDAQFNSYQAPLSFAPIGLKTDIRSDFVATRGDEIVGTYPTFEEAEATLRAAEPEVFKQADLEAKTLSVQAESARLDELLRPLIAKFNLGDVGLNIVDRIANNAGGSYSGLNKLIEISMTGDKPLLTMRHEALHALKDLDFFTPQQWKALTERANKDWLVQLKKTPYEEGVSRYDAYLDMFTKEGQAKGLQGPELEQYANEALIEESIADAFGAYESGVKPPPGLIAALFKKLKDFFKNFGQALRGAGFESSEDIFERVERGELKSRKPKAKKAEEKLSLPIMRGEEVPKFEGPPKEGKTEPTKIKPTVDSIGKYFDDQVREEFGSSLDFTDKANFDRAVKLASEEVAFQLKSEKSGLDWYEDDIKDAFKQTKKLIPELGKVDNRLLFSVMAGIMSPQTTARDNWFIAAKAFQHYVGAGVIPGINPETGGLWTGGTTSVNKKTQLDFLNKMVKDMGQKKALEWLFTDHTVKEINSFRLKYGNVKSGIDGKLTDMRPGLYAFGPKVGPFVSNLNGIPDVTVDKWMTRTFNRYFGKMLGPDGKIIEAPTEPQRRAIKALINEVAKNAGIKPYQVQSLLWFYEQQLFTKIGVLSPSYGFSDGAKRFVEAGGRGGEKGVGDANAPATSKLSLKKGIVAEVAPNPDQVTAEKWREMTPKERINSTKAVADKTMSAVFSELGFTGYSYTFSSGKYEGEVNPNIIVEAPENATTQELDELGRVLGYVLDQKAMVVFDETNKTSDSQAGFVKVRIPEGMTPDELGKLRDHIAKEVPQADGDTLRDGSLMYGNFSAYNDKVDTLDDKQYHQAIRDAIESFPYDGVIDVSAPETFHSSFIAPDTRSDYLKETRYGDSKRLQGEAGADVRGQGSRRLQAISENAIALRDRWIDSRGAARIGSGERGSEIDYGKPTAEYGEATKDSVSAIGVHFSQEPRATLSSEYHGAGLRGLERERLNNKDNADIRSRIYFYVDNGKGIRPEAGVGGAPHVIQLNNLYNTKTDPLQILRNTKGDSQADRASQWERGVREAGFDGYLVKDLSSSQDYAVLIGKHAVTTKRFSLKNVAFPSVKAAKEAVSGTEVPKTEAFKRFIAGNQWSDKDGNPKVFYHATAREFFEFTPAGQSQAIFLAETPEEAETFGSIAEDRLRREIYRALTKDEKLDFFQRVVDAQEKEGSITAKQGTEFMRQAKRKVPEYGSFGDIEQETYDALLDLSPTRMSIMPLYARAETPFDFQNPEHVEQVMQWVANNTEYPQDFPDKWLAGIKGRISQGLWQAIEDKRVQQAIRTLGFDAFTVREGRNSPKNYAVYTPEQVKSVTGNIGEYGRETKDMRFSLRTARMSESRFDSLLNQSDYTQDGDEKKAKMYLGFVNPINFVYANASFPTLKRLRSEQEPLDIEKMRTLGPISLTMSKDKENNWTITGHEGRHRMLALADEGFKEVPVVIDFGSGIDNTESIPIKAVNSPKKDAVGLIISSDLLITGLEPLSYANRDNARSKFTNFKPVKLSLPTFSTAINDQVNATTFTRERKGFVERMIAAITPISAGEFRARALNQFNQMSVNDKKLAEQRGGIALLADESSESAALMSDLGAGIAASAMGIGDRNGGIPVLRNGITTIDTSVKGLVASLSPLAAYNDPKVYQYYQYWAMVKRGKRLDKQGKLTGITTTDVAYAAAIEAKFPKDLFNNVQKDLIAFNNGLVKYMVDTGVLSKERGVEYMKYADYVPFYRQMDGENTIGPNLFQSLSGVKPPKKLKGKDVTEAPLADFLETMVRNTQSAIQAGIKNYAGQRAVNVASQIKAPGMGVTRLPKPSTADDVINVLEKGELVSYQTPDKLLIDAVKSLNLSDLPFMGILSAPADLLRNLVTKDPGFMMANLLRDSLSAYVTSGVKMTPVVDTVMAYGKSLARTSPTFELLLNAGIISGYDSGNIEKSGLNLEKDLAKKAGQKDALLLRPFTSLWDALEKGTTASDAATRVVIYERVLAETGNEAEALFRSLEVMNFHRKGNSVLIRVLTAAVPFFNARLQGLDLFYRASTGNMNNKDAAAIQRQFFVRGMTMMALSTAYWFMVSDDEEYKKQEQETKDNNWLIPYLGIRIPIPFEVGVLFKTIPERIAAYTFGNDTGKDLRDSLFRNAVSTFAFNPIPQTIKPLVEAGFDINTFTWRPIISEGMKDVDPQYQVGPGTSSVAKGIAGVLGLSPMKVDHVIKGYTGTMGMYAVDTLDMVMDQFGDSPRATKRFEQLPIIKRFALDPEARGNVTEYYKLKDSVDSVVRTMNFLEKQGESEQYVEYLKENQGTFAFKDYIRDTEKTMKELRQMKSAVQISKMSGDEKRDAITGINRAENAINAEIQRIKTIISSSQ